MISRVQDAGARRLDPERSTRYLWWWLMVAIVFEYARPAAFVPVLDALKLTSLIPISLLLIVVFSGGLRRMKEIFSDPVSKWILIYLVIIAFSVVTAVVTLRAFNVTKLVLGYVFLAFMIVRIATTTERVHGIFATLILAHLFLLAMNLEVVLQPEQRNYVEGGSFLGDGNDFSLSVCILLPMSIELALAAGKRPVRFLWWGALLTLLLAVIGSSSRGASLALVAVAVYLWLRSPRKGAVLAIVGTVAALLFAYAPDLYFERMGSIAHYEEDGSAMGRIYAWEAAIQMFVHNPLLGVSAGHFPVMLGTEYLPPEAGNMAWLTAHSMYFLVLGELGLPGTIALLTLIFGNMRLNTKLRHNLTRHSTTDASQSDAGGVRPDRTLYLLNASMLGFAVAGAFLSVAYYPHVFVLSALMISTRLNAKREDAARQAGREEGATSPARRQGKRPRRARPT